MAAGLLTPVVLASALVAGFLAWADGFSAREEPPGWEKSGVRLTGMPAWGEETRESDRESWQLVHFIRQLPRLTAAEIAQMRSLNPKTPAEQEAEKAERTFLAGGPPPEAGAPAAGHRH